MLAGELYNAMDPELVQLRYKARDLFTKYNQIPYDDLVGRKGDDQQTARQNRTQY